MNFEQLGRHIHYVVLNDLLQVVMNSGLRSGANPLISYPQQAVKNIQQFIHWARTSENEQLKLYAAELLEDSACMLMREQ